MPKSGEVRINGTQVFINDKQVASMKPIPPEQYARRLPPVAQGTAPSPGGSIPRGKPGQMICVFKGSGEAADVPKSSNPKEVGSGGHGRLVCYVDGSPVFDEPASNVTKPEIAYKRMHKDWRSRRNIRNASFPAPVGEYTMSKLDWSSKSGRDVIHLGINSRDGVEIHSIKHGKKFAWWDTEGCIRVQKEPLQKLGELLKSHPGKIVIKEGRD